jgi:hypothetical protein
MSKESMKSLLFNGQLLLRHRRALAIALVAVIVEGIVDLAEPWPIKIAIDYVIGTKQVRQS